MRLDKYLWAVRIFKTRSIAIDAIKNGKVKFNGDNVKPAREIKTGEIFTINIQHITKTVKVIDLLQNRVSAKEVDAFMEDLTPQAEYDKNKMSQARFVFRPLGIGRPTKKERRDIDDWFEQGDEKKED